MAGPSSEQTIIGNVGAIYEIRRVGKDNKAVIEFSVAITHRYRDGNDWKDGETTWVNVTAWERLAENVEKSLRKGDRVIVKGRNGTKPSFTKDDGTVLPPKPFLTADYVGLELGWDAATSSRESRDSSSSAPASAKRSAAPKAKVAPKAKAKDDLDFDFGDDEPPAF